MSKGYFNIRLLTVTILSAGMVCILVPGISKAQTVYRLFAVRDMVIKITGTSNLNNWSLTSMNTKTQGNFEFDNSGQLIRLSALSFSVSVKSLKSGNKALDRRVYKTLKSNQFPVVTFKLDSSGFKPMDKNSYDLKVRGILSIGAVSRVVRMKMGAVVGTNNTVSFNGSKKIRLSDYRINPPGMMFGIFRVGNDVMITYTLTYNK